ncbi:RHS repeat-associated core domain protein containing protein [Herbaspirillum sp. CF444]|uniref:RHS repeat-associated core domain-containing protein n=1 Tax=Herbaspirillum sp. CF444 TaxID=1144319 RepID=UPI0002726E63|nr:RHS repeat-associated core domain-containing protein [Herbaspirillum sp. CF444]EJL88509.1 RHS repeat-associated core domain protein containing protein [Herbaspirillum sp. CF444]
MNTSILGYNGQRQDPVSGTYHLGNGYRAYNPVLMRFNSPDAWSPFGAGGINAYAYCAGDPVNYADPSGHLSWQAWLGIGMGIAGLALTIVTAGASMAAAGGVMAAIESTSAVSLAVGITGALADVSAIASGASEDVDPQASAILGWVSMGTGAVGLVQGGIALARRANSLYETGVRLVSKLQRVNGRIGIPMSGEFRRPRFWGLYGNFQMSLTFEDEATNGGPRLNIVVGTLLDLDFNSMRAIRGDGDFLSPTSLVRRLEASGVVGDTYSEYRLVMNYAAQQYGTQNFAAYVRHELIRILNVDRRTVGVIASRGEVRIDSPVDMWIGDRMNQMNLPLNADALQGILDGAEQAFAGQSNLFTLRSEPDWVRYPYGVASSFDG